MNQTELRASETQASTGAASSGSSAKPSPIVKAKDTFSLVATAIPTLGLVGTVAVWAASNFYVGDVEIATDKPFTNLTVKAYDKKGQESTFHTPRFQLMPGSYHLEVSAADAVTQHADAEVAFQKKAVVPVTIVNAGQIEDEATTNEDKEVKRHWWQLWKRQ